MTTWLYILECADGSYYTGITGNLPQRLAQHRSGNGGGYTRRRLPVKLVYAQGFCSKMEAASRERQIKRWPRARKEALMVCYGEEEMNQPGKVRGIFVTGVNETEILEFPQPEPGPYQALVRVRACGICNSTDWKIIEGEFVRGTFPILLGHESIGEVIRVGQEVRHFKEGDLVLRSRLEHGHLPFPGGRSCWGGFVERALVTDAWAEKGAAYNAFPHPQQIVPSHIPPAIAVGLITLKETLSCLQNSDVRPGQSLAIVGTGPVAQTLALFAKLSGISPVAVFGRRSAWAERFAALGVDAYAAGDDFPPEVRAILDRGGFDRAIEAVGARSALSRCLEVVKAGGRVNLYGIAPQSEPYLPQEEGDPRVFRSNVAEPETHDQVLQWVEEGKVRLHDWVSHEMPWTDYQRGFDMIHDKTANKVALTF